MSAIQSDAERLAIHREIETEGQLTPAQRRADLTKSDEFCRLFDDCVRKAGIYHRARRDYQEAQARVDRALASCG